MIIDCVRYDIDNQSGSVTLPDAARYGCDSLITVELDYYIAKDSIEIYDLCIGDTFDLNGIRYTESVEIKDTLYYDIGCDSIYVNQSLKFSNNSTPIELEGDTIVCEIESTQWKVTSMHTDLKLDGAPIDNDFTIDGVGMYSVSGIDLNGCVSEKTIEINTSSLAIEVDQDYSSLEVESQIVLEPIYSSDVLSYLWSPSDGLSCSDCPYPQLISTEDQVYRIEITNRLGCKKTAIINVAFKNDDLYIPNVITRNSSISDNSFFYLQSKKPVLYQMKILDRWGNLIFDKSSISSNDRESGWSPEQDLEQGVYVYIIYDEAGNILRTGSITLL